MAIPPNPDARLIDGTQVAAASLAATAERAQDVYQRTGTQPCLAAVLVGDDPASAAYVRTKQLRCTRAGILSRLAHLPASSTTAEVVSAIERLSDDAAHVDLTGMHAVVLGRSPILGRPMGMLLLARNATVTYCHSHTRELPAIVRTADLVVAAVGNPRFVRGSWIKPGAVVIDAGYNPGNVGDVHFEEVLSVAGLVTPVPDGVGPTTTAVLLDQTVTAAERWWDGQRRP